MNLQDTLQAATQQLEQAGVPSPRYDAQWLLLAVLNTSRAVLLEPDRQLTPSQLEQFWGYIYRRMAREPLQWILGNTEFFGLELLCTPGVLIPRPETERLVELALERLPNTGRVVDVGCGSGAIACAIKANRPDLEVWATDISPSAIALTQENADLLRLQLEVRQTSLLEGLDLPFDAIISNPPYLPNGDELSKEVQLEPKEALFSGEDGLGLARALVQAAQSALKPNGWLMLELDPRNAPMLQLEMVGWQTWLEADLLGRERFLLAQPSARLP